MIDRVKGTVFGQQVKTVNDRKIQSPNCKSWGGNLYPAAVTRWRWTKNSQKPLVRDFYGSCDAVDYVVNAVCDDTEIHVPVINVFLR